jgi:hypothetical protein
VLTPHLLQVQHEDGVLLQQQTVLLLQIVQFLGLVASHRLNYLGYVIVLPSHDQLELAVLSQNLLADADSVGQLALHYCQLLT